MMKKIMTRISKISKTKMLKISNNNSNRKINKDISQNKKAKYLPNLNVLKNQQIIIRLFCQVSQSKIHGSKKCEQQKKNTIPKYLYYMNKVKEFQNKEDAKLKNK